MLFASLVHVGNKQERFMELTADTVMRISMNRGKPEICTMIADFITKNGDSYQLNTAMRIKHFLGQCAVESGMYTKLEESLYYSIDRLQAVWPKRFPNSEAAAPYAKNPQALANKTYGGRMGNDGANDGWLYRGSSIKMITGKENFATFTRWMRNLDPSCPNFIANPDALRSLDWAIWPAVWYWVEKKCYEYADDDDVKGLTRVINGGLIGYEDRMAATAYAGKILNMKTNPDIAIAKPSSGADPLLKEYQSKLLALSEKLSNPKLNPGEPDGWNGAQTASAVAYFQETADLVTDGKLGPNTRKYIDAACQKAGV